MRFTTRVFLFSFLPFAAVLCLAFVAVQGVVTSYVRHDLRASLSRTQDIIEQAWTRNQQAAQRLFAIIGDNAPLKASVQLALLNSDQPDAARTVEDQLLDICKRLRLDLAFVSDAAGRPIAAVVRRGEQEWRALDAKSSPKCEPGLCSFQGATYHVASVVLDQDEEILGQLSVGENFDLSGLGAPAVLAFNGRVVRSGIQRSVNGTLERALEKCPPIRDCEIQLGGEHFLLSPINSIDFGSAYRLWTAQNIDSAVRPALANLRRIFVLTGAGALLVGLFVSLCASRSVVRPLAALVRQLWTGAATGTLPKIDVSVATVKEIRQVAVSLNRAAEAVDKSNGQLRRAYVEFIGSLASALDARDTYTAGHSERVSQYSCAIGAVLRLTALELEQLRIGALLHDIGKIGIPDSVLQKPGRLSPEEYALIQQHPTIGCRILDKVDGFQPYLPIVELHHENWDGSGYPFGLKGDHVPLLARIVHVADAFDAMTSDRPYRKGMEPGKAVRIVNESSGLQFDPAVVQAFNAVFAALAPSPDPDLARLARRVERDGDREREHIAAGGVSA